MVDLLGHHGLLIDAYLMIKDMPLEPNCGDFRVPFLVLVGFIVTSILGRKLQRI